MIQYQIQTEKGQFLITELDDFKIKISMLEDFTNTIFESEEDDYAILDHHVTALTTYNTCNDLHTALIQKYSKIEKNDKPITGNVVDTFHLTNLIRNEDDANRFLQKVLQNGRVPLKLENKSIIQVCRPLLCFENKDQPFKENRLEVERQYWIKIKNKGEQESPTKQEKDMAFLALKMLTLF